MTRVLYHLIFWIFIFFFVLDYFIYEQDFNTAIRLTSTECVLYMIVSYFNLFVLIKKFLVKKKLRNYLISVVLFLIVLFTIYSYLGLGTVLLHETFYKTLASFTLNYLLFIIISFLYWYVLLFQKEKHRTLELQNQKLQSEIQLVKSQISPHFLFNSLNNIYSLSLNNKNKEAQKMIEILSDILRYFLYNNNNKTTSLASEVKIIKKFIDFHKLKTPNANVEFNINNSIDFNTYEIIPLILITIIENGFKHSDISFNPDGFFKINLEIINNTLLLKTENTFNPSIKSNNSDNQNGLGLNIIKKQLKYYYSKKHSLSIIDTDNIYKLTLTINL